MNTRLSILTAWASLIGTIGGVGAALYAENALSRVAIEWIVDGGPAAAMAMLLSPPIVFALAIRGIRRSHLHHREIRLRLQREREAQREARLDPLSGLLNRRAFLGDLGEAVEGRRRGRELALMLIDLDRFKQINDVYGHHAGDGLIREVANRLRTVCPPVALIARIGGDEFSIALPCEASTDVETVAQRIVEALAAPFVLEGLPMSIGASIGIAVMNGESAIDDVMNEADIAMYRAKQDGRNCWRWFDQSMQAWLQERQQIETELQPAIAQGQIVPYFEPQIDLETKTVTGFEILARWLHPREGVVPPSRFIAIAEETAQISDLCFAVLRQAIAEVRQWSTDISLAVNISPIQMRDPAFPPRLIQLLIEEGFPAPRLQVEITESALISDLPRTKAVVESLRNQGVRVVLDDFGTGYSSLHHLRALPFDCIKIDRSYVGKIVDCPDAQAVVRAVMALGESLKISVAAEGIETEEIETALLALNCRRGQGWHYARAVPAAEAHRLIADGIHGDREKVLGSRSGSR